MAMDHTVTVYNAKGKIESVNHFHTQDDALDFLDSQYNKKTEYKNNLALESFRQGKKMY